MCHRDDLLIDVAKKLIDKQIDAVPVVKEVDNGYEVIGQNYKNKYYKGISHLSRGPIT